MNNVEQNNSALFISCKIFKKNNKKMKKIINRCSNVFGTIIFVFHYIFNVLDQKYLRK